MSEYYGRPTCIISNATLELECLITAGPRIVGLRYIGSANLLAEVPSIAVSTTYGDFHYMGGHRLWHAPENMPRTYIPDDDGCTFTQLSDGALLEGKREEGSGICKSIEIHLEHEAPRVRLLHTLMNENQWEVKLAPWAITMFRLGGRVLIPTRAEKVDLDGLLPDRHLTLWPYAHINDDRLKLQNDLIQINAQPGGSFKVGTFNPRGWMSYQIDGILFKKSFDVRSGQEHVDLGCNAECYCDQDFVELESLAPLSVLPAGEKVQWVETWELSRVGDLVRP